MKIPSYSKLNYAMHLLCSCFVELFPKLQLLDLTVYPDRFMVDFSFARELADQEIELLRVRFFEKIKRKERGDVREMVSKNACDLLRHYNQFFLTDLVDREEMFADMLCMNVYNGPVKGALDQDIEEVKELTLEMHDLGAKKWMKRRVHHYRMETFVYQSSADAKAARALNSGKCKKDHLFIGEKDSLFWAHEGQVSFSNKGELLFQDLVQKASSFFGDLVYFSGSEKDFQIQTNINKFSMYLEMEGDYSGVCYGLKDAECIRALMSYNFSDSFDIVKREIESFSKELGLAVECNKDGDFVVYDYKGIPWTCAEINSDNKYLILEVNLQRYFALLLENKIK